MCPPGAPTAGTETGRHESVAVVAPMLASIPLPVAAGEQVAVARAAGLALHRAVRAVVGRSDRGRHHEGEGATLTAGEAPPVTVRLAAHLLHGFAAHPADDLRVGAVLAGLSFGDEPGTGHAATTEAPSSSVLNAASA